MRILLSVVIFCLGAAAFACSSERTPSSPRKTFEAYVRALKAKDAAAMKRLLTSETVKMHEQEAKSMGTTVDEIIKREMIVAEGQKVVEFRNEKIEGERATLEVKNSFGDWETIYFILEGGVWKIDKKGFADQLLREVEEENRQTDEEMNLNRPIPFDTASPIPTPPFDSVNTDGPNPRMPRSDGLDSNRPIRTPIPQRSDPNGR
jgi:hypothetical protein